MPDETPVVRQFRRGDAAVFRVLVDREARYLYAIAHGLCGDAAEAEDLVQETFLAALTSRFRGEASARTWLVKILLRRAGLLRRTRWHRRRRGSLEDASADGWAADTVATPQQSGTEARIDVATMLACLSPEHRAVIVLRELQGMTYEEMAAVLDVPRGTVESRLHRAREEIRRRFKGYS